jgi:signal transduction histidine kinase
MHAAPRSPLVSDPTPDRVSRVSRLRPVFWIALDCLVALGYAGWLIAGLVSEPNPGVYLPLGLGATVAAGLAMALRRRYPLGALVVVLVALMAVGWPHQVSLPPMAYVLYLAAHSYRGWRALAALAATLLAPVPAVLWGSLTITGYIFSAELAAAVWFAGFVLGRYREYEADRRRHRARLAEAEVEKARRAVTDERLRIARELHDVLAHSMSVITVQAGFGHLVIDDRPAEAKAALGAIETTGREALVQMRRLLGVLRADGPDSADGGGAALTPAPGLADLDRLVAQTAKAGVRVDLRITGRPRELPAGIDLSAYRIVQEALTNVVRHAQTPAGRVAVDYGSDELSIEITDDGPECPNPDTPVSADDGVGAGGRHGLIGMRERVGLYGGRFSAGPLPTRGFRVAAQLPLGDDAADNAVGGSA